MVFSGHFSVIFVQILPKFDQNQASGIPEMVDFRSFFDGVLSFSRKFWIYGKIRKRGDFDMIVGELLRMVRSILEILSARGAPFLDSEK